MDKTTPLVVLKWGKQFNFSDTQWENIFVYPFQYTKHPKLQWLQFRINNYKLTTNYFLFKLGKLDNNTCGLCKGAEESIIHLLWDCPMTKALIASFKNICTTKGLNIIFEKAFIFGIFYRKERYIISLIIKSYIHRKRCLQENILVHELLIDL